MFPQSVAKSFEGCQRETGPIFKDFQAPSHLLCFPSSSLPHRVEVSRCGGIAEEKDYPDALLYELQSLSPFAARDSPVRLQLLLLP